MKKLYLLMAITYVTATYCYAQDESSKQSKAQFGGKIGVNFSNVYDAEGESFDADGKFGLAAGLFVTLPIGNILGIQPEVLFSQKGYNASGSFLGSTYQMSRTSNYIDVPLLAFIKPIETLTILAGPQYSYLVSQTCCERSKAQGKKKRGIGNDPNKGKHAPCQRYSVN